MKLIVSFWNVVEAAPPGTAEDHMTCNAVSQELRNAMRCFKGCGCLLTNKHTSINQQTNQPTDTPTNGHANKPA